MANGSKQKEGIDEGTILLGFLIMVIGLLAVFFACLFTGLDFGQPQPTSNLISKSINVTDNSIAILPGLRNEMFDSNGYGYYYTIWFKRIYLNHIYNITYYCNKDGDRQIYTYVDTMPTPEDKAKCIVVNGVCQ